MSIESFRRSSWLVVALCMQAGDAATQSCPAPRVWATASRGHDGAVLQVADNYAYVPTLMFDGTYRSWFCTGHYEGVGPSRSYHGDQVAYSTAPSPAGPWSTPVPVFRNSGNAAAFDGFHTCDPSVIRVNGVYYMYYGGHNNIVYPAHGYTSTAIGVSTSVDGTSWSRLNGAQPIVTAARGAGHPAYPSLAATRGYGAGQPSVTHVDGLFYLAYTDTTGYASNSVNGAGIYVLRSPDPTFRTAVEALVGPGTFAPRTTLNQTSFRLLEAFSVDWQFVDMLDAFAVADAVIDPGGKRIRVSMWNRSLGTVFASHSQPADWNEGPGLISRPDKHALASPISCGTVPIDLLRSVGPAGDFSRWGLAHIGFDFSTNLSCACARLPRVFEGTAVAAPGHPWAVVVGGLRLHFQLAAPLLTLAKTVHHVAWDIYTHIPAGPSLFQGSPVYYSNGTPGAFLLGDGRLWPASCYDLVTANASSMAYVSPWQWSQHPIGPALFCVR